MSNNKILILALLVATLLTGCAHKDDVERIGIISAMDNEISVLLEKAEIEQEDLVGGMKYYVGRLSGKNVVITRAGIGKVRASSGVTTMLNKYNISKVLFTGIAGGVADETQVLDEVVATRLVEHDYGIIGNDGFLWVSGDPGTSRKAGEYYYCDKNLVDSEKMLGKSRRWLTRTGWRSCWRCSMARSAHVFYWRT